MARVRHQLESGYTEDDLSEKDEKFTVATAQAPIECGFIRSSPQVFENLGDLKEEKPNRQGIGEKWLVVECRPRFKLVLGAAG